ncbi:MAG: LLM class flavin-dependent oxidoreductase [Beijerinckiaceae bacterium]
MSASRYRMYNNNAFKIGLFGANCSSGRAWNTLPERWPADWESCEKMAKLADAGGIDFLLPIGRWKGYGGETDFQGTTFETITWATGLLAHTRRIMVFGTVHAPLFNPLVAAKMMVTADHVGRGRFGLNIVVGWNEPEFQMAGIAQHDHGGRYEYGEEWIASMKKMWSEREPFDYDGEYLHLRNVVAKPKLYRDLSPLIINAGQSATGRAFAMRHCHAFFTNFREADVQRSADFVAKFKADAMAQEGREVDVFTQGHVVCRPTRKEAEDYFRYLTTEAADYGALTEALRLKGVTPQNTPDFDAQLKALPPRNVGYPIVGSPDDVAGKFARMHSAGLSGVAFSLVHYVNELPFLIEEVLPRMERLGLRAPAAQTVQAEGALA